MTAARTPIPLITKPRTGPSYHPQSNYIRAKAHMNFPCPLTPEIVYLCVDKKFFHLSLNFYSPFVESRTFFKISHKNFRTDLSPRVTGGRAKKLSWDPNPMMLGEKILYEAILQLLLYYIIRMCVQNPPHKSVEIIPHVFYL